MGKYGVGPKELFETIGDENKDLVSRYAIDLKKLVRDLKSGIPITSSCKITIMDKKVADEWIEFFDNFKTHTD